MEVVGYCWVGVLLPGREMDMTVALKSKKTSSRGLREIWQ